VTFFSSHAPALIQRRFRNGRQEEDIVFLPLFWSRMIKKTNRPIDDGGDVFKTWHSKSTPPRGIEKKKKS
jgi:hypothetical protein